MVHPAWRVAALAPLMLGLAVCGAAAEERAESFDRDPGWEGRNNMRAVPATRSIRQDFGYSRTSHNGGPPGEAGGLITPAAEPAFYARKIAPKTLNDPLSASGTLVFPGPKGHLLLGFFNTGTLNEWRTPNSIALRLLGRGDRFLAYVEYATTKWRAGADSPGGFATLRDPQTGRAQLAGFPVGPMVYRWSIRYDPDGNRGAGVIHVRLGDQEAACNLDPGHRQDGATFNHFGLLPVLKSADDAGEVWIDNVTVEGRTEDFGHDPGWEGRNNRRTYPSANIRPQFAFGYRPTRYAGGAARGEMGGLVFRGDCREASRLACYGDRLSPLTTRQPLRASGCVSLRRGVSDSTTLLGFYHSEESMAVSDSQASMLPRCFLGIAVEGPSREGFFFSPVYRGRGDARWVSADAGLPRILPDGKPHRWLLEFQPSADGGGTLRLRFDGQECVLSLSAADLAGAVRFNRFGLVTTWIDGNAQLIYFDDLRYTCAP